MDGPYSLTGNATHLGQQLRFSCLFFGHFSRVSRHPSVCKPNEYDVGSCRCQRRMSVAGTSDFVRQSFADVLSSFGQPLVLSADTIK